MLRKSELVKRKIFKTIIVLGMLSGIGIVAMAEFLYPGFTNMAKNDQLYRYGFGLFLGSPIVVCLSIILFYKVRGKNYPRWFGFEGFEICNKKINVHYTNNSELYDRENMYTSPKYSSLSGNIYNRFR